MAIFQALTEKSNWNTNLVVDHSLVAVRKVLHLNYLMDSNLYKS